MLQKENASQQQESNPIQLDLIFEKLAHDKLRKSSEKEIPEKG